MLDCACVYVVVSLQLEWPTIEAVLWMPQALSKEPRLVALRQLAVNAVKQVCAISLYFYVAVGLERQ